MSKNVDNGIKTNGGDRTKVARIKKKNLENTIERIKNKRNCSTAKAIEYICHEYEEMSKDSWERIEGKLNEAKEIAEEQEQEELINRTKFLLDDIKRGDRRPLEILYKTFADPDGKGPDEVLDFLNGGDGG